MARRPVVIGHRGWLQKYPENTLVSLTAAVELGCEALEFDLHLSRDGHVVVMHDATVDRTTDGAGRIGEMTLAELKRLDAGSWLDASFAGERVPTLEEVLAAVPPEILLYAEVKDGRPEMVDALLPLLAPRGEAAIVHSFDAEFLAAFRRAAPWMRTGLLGNVTKQDLLAEARGLGCWGIHPCIEGLTRERVAAWQAEGFAVMVWTVRDEADARAALGLEPDAIGADCPDVVLKMRDA